MDFLKKCVNWDGDSNSSVYIRAGISSLMLYLWALISTNIAFQRITLTVFGCRIIYAIIVFIASLYIQDVIRKSSWLSVKHAVIAFLVYEVLNMLIFRLIYPGAWKWDDINVFNSLMSSGHLNYWQHYLTIVFYILCLCLFPFPAGIVMVQFTIVAVIFGYCFYVLSAIPKGGRCKYLILAPFFFIPTLDFNQWPLRLSLYCMLEILLVVLIVEPRIKGKTIWEFHRRCVFIVFLTAVLSNWRTEGLLYVIMIPCCLLLLYNKPLQWRKAAGLFVSAAMLTGILSVPQRIGMSTSEDYDLTGLLLPITPLCAEAVNNQDKEIIEPIDKVLNVNEIAKSYQEGSDAMVLFWSDRASLIRYGFDDEDYNEMKKGYLKLILKYPTVYLRERIQCFLSTWRTPGTGSIGWLYTTDNPNVQYFATHYCMNRPISNPVRMKVGEILNAEGNKDTLWAFNYYAQTIAVVLFTFYLLLKRSKWLLLALMMEVRMILTFLTAPGRIFMYYYNLWLFGSFIICGVLAYLLFRRTRCSLCSKK